MEDLVEPQPKQSQAADAPIAQIITPEVKINEHISFDPTDGEIIVYSAFTINHSNPLNMFKTGPSTYHDIQLSDPDEDEVENP